MLLIDYINLHHNGNRSEFARHMGVGKNDVYVWIRKGWLVVDNKLCIPKREIPKILIKAQK